MILPFAGGSLFFGGIHSDVEASAHYDMIQFEEEFLKEIVEVASSKDSCLRAALIPSIKKQTGAVILVHFR